MIAIVSGALSLLTFLAVAKLWWALKGMKLLGLRWIEAVETFFVFSLMGAFLSAIVAAILILQAPPFAPWQHPLVWVQGVGLATIVIVATGCSNAVINTRRNRSRLKRSAVEHRVP